MKIGCQICAKWRSVLWVVIIIGSNIVASLAYAKSDVSTTLVVKPYTITVHGKKATEYRIEQPDGTWGFVGTEGQIFDATVVNEIKEPTVLHWHGLLVPNDQDGVPGVTQLLIEPGRTYHYHFMLNQSGTYWMHSHYEMQLQQLLSAPFIIKDLHNPYPKAQDVTMLLSDFSFRDPGLIYDQLKTQMTMAAPGGMANMPGMDHAMNTTKSKANSHAHQDLNDVQYDAYLANYHTLEDPNIVTVQPNSLVRLRIINGAAASNFFVHVGKLSGTLIAVDGEPIKSLTTEWVALTMGQRADILVRIPNEEGNYPILAQVEGTQYQTGLILKTPGVNSQPVSEKSASVAGAMTMKQEFQLSALHPLPKKPIDRQLVVDLEGDMKSYVWKINHQVWPDVTPLIVKKGERVEIVFNNHTMMSHPMHLHGHVFEVTEINGKAFQGANRDTVLVPINGTVKVQFDADNPGDWMLHCHVLYHAMGGMMTLINYEKFNSSEIK